MEPKIRQHIETLFLSAPQTAKATELKEEIIKNTVERYHDRVAEGMSEAEAYNKAIDAIGDTEELFAELGGTVNAGYTNEQLAAVPARSHMMLSIAIALYIMCVTPVILLANTPLVNIAPTFMFWMISAATGLLVYSRTTKYIPLEADPASAAALRRKGIMKGAGIALLISCVTPPILMSGSDRLAAISPVLMFAMIAAGVVLLILGRTGKNRVTVPKIKIDKSQLPHRRSAALYKVFVALLWIFASAGFIVLIVFNPYSVVAAWGVFPLAAALQGVIHAVFDYTEAEQ